MAGKKMSARDFIRLSRLELDLTRELPCTPEENEKYEKLLSDGEPLPEGVYPYYSMGEESTKQFYTVEDNGLDERETEEFLTLKRLSYLKTIKNCVVFFTVLTVVGIIAGIMLAAA